MLPEAHQLHVKQAVQKAWVLFGLVLFGVALEVGMGLFLWNELGDRGTGWTSSTIGWCVGLGLVAVVEGVLGLLVHRWLVRPRSLMKRLREALQKHGLGDSVPPELLTVVAVRASFLADVVAWLLLQFITIYGLILVVVTGQLWVVLTFAVASVVLLLRAAPSARRTVALIEALRGMA